MHFEQSLYIAFTTDLWTDNYRRKSRFSLTCHYISVERKLVNFALVFKSSNKIKKQQKISRMQYKFGTRKAEVLNSLIINTTAKANDTTDILQTFR